MSMMEPLILGIGGGSSNRTPTDQEVMANPWGQLLPSNIQMS